ncbi:MAG: VPLPA-CTERM sorting domain-containing protein [Proteobacteria bacterium]|nr:VPLPA-CTERM sorting domain-containing protein [Pseudomonadota bacterium]
MRRWSLLLVLLWVASSAEAAPPGLTLLEVETAGVPVVPNGVSDDGRIAAGVVQDAQLGPIFWIDGERQIGFPIVGGPPGAGGTVYTGVSGDGTTLVGFQFSDVTNQSVAIRADPVARQGLALPTFGDGLSATAADVSRDGGVIVGSGRRLGGGNEAAVWVNDEIQGLGFLAGDTESLARGVTRDGTIVVGASGGRAVLWDEGTAVELTGFGSDTASSLAQSVASDGAVVVGDLVLDSGATRGFVWEAGNVLVLGDLSGGDDESHLLDVAGDGQRAVGWSDSSRGDQAVIWDPVRGLRSLEDALVNEFGIDPGLFGGIDRLQRATSISEDGRVISGIGIFDGSTNPFLVVLPEPASAWLLGAGLAALASFGRRQRFRA